ncbi:MAG: hypothetical protein WBD46_07790 [Acidobacteriaceae bacterium]
MRPPSILARTLTLLLALAVSALPLCPARTSAHNCCSGDSAPCAACVAHAPVLSCIRAAALPAPSTALSAPVFVSLNTSREMPFTRAMPLHRIAASPHPRATAPPPLRI